MAISAGLVRETKEASPVNPGSIFSAVTQASIPKATSVGAVQEMLLLHKEQISSWLSEPDMTAKQVFRLLTEQGYPFSYTSIKRYVRNLKPEHSQHVTVRLETAAGDQAQVDFGQVSLLL